MKDLTYYIASIIIKTKLNHYVQPWSIYRYYMGKVQALQLEYADAYRRLSWAARKAPQDAAPSFNLVVTKLTILVQLLMGEIPERSVSVINI